MTDMSIQSNIEKVCKQFCIEGSIESIEQMKSGHINDTYMVSINNEGIKKYTIQAINSKVFKNPKLISDNIIAITAHIKNKLLLENKPINRRFLNFRPCKDGNYYFIDGDNRFWRVYDFVDNASSYNRVTDLDMLRSAGAAFGEFQRFLSDFPIASLHETIADFHNTEKRLEQLKEAVKLDVCGRVSEVLEEIKFFEERKEVAAELSNLQKAGVLPLRVTHNDTKYNNVLIDDDTKEAICIIDLDTVMPGLSVHDFGDAIRFAASSADEDETDIDKIHINFDAFEAFTSGFIGNSKGFFEKAEIENMVNGVKIITIELASRFLTDYINGDVYFRTHYKGQNLDRARNQMKLVEDVEKNFDKLNNIVLKYL